MHLDTVGSGAKDGCLAVRLHAQVELELCRHDEHVAVVHPSRQEKHHLHCIHRENTCHARYFHESGSFARRPTDRDASQPENLTHKFHTKFALER